MMKYLFLPYNISISFRRYFQNMKKEFSASRKYMRLFLPCIVCFSWVMLITSLWAIPAQSHSLSDDSTAKAKELRETASVKTSVAAIKMTVQNVDVTRFPEVRLIVDAFSSDGVPLDTLTIKDIKVVENGVEKKVLSIDKISVKERIPVDFIFVIDVTGTMQAHINGVKSNVEKFVETLVSRGIDYRLGLVLFSDFVEKTYQPTTDVKEFLRWLSTVWASGGFDEKENALEALAETKIMKWRPPANRVALMITDAPYHQRGEGGNGRTKYTTQSIIDTLRANSVRTFCIAPPTIKEYKTIADGTNGIVFDIAKPFATILDQYSTQLTNLYAVTYRTDQAAIPDSLNVGILDQNNREIIRKIIPVVEIGRKLIIENLLFPTGSFALPDSVYELEVIREFLTNKPKVKILIEGHTDSRGSKKGNLLLSERRAHAVREYLLRKNIRPERITIKGLGDTRPIATNDTDFGRKINRRTEIVIIEK